MDGSTNSGGFDAALKALEDLESDVAREKDRAAAPADPLAGLSLTSSLAFSPDAEPVSAPVQVVDAELIVAAAPDEAGIGHAATPPVVEERPEPIVAVPAAEPHAPIEATIANKPRRGLLPIAAAGLGVFASLLSVIGLLVAVRTVNAASLVVADARERQAQLVQVGRLLGDLEKIRARQIELLKLQTAATASAPLTVDQFHGEMDAMRNEVSKREPDQVILQAVNDQQSDLSDKLGVIGTKLTRIEDRLTAH